MCSPESEELVTIFLTLRKRADHPDNVTKTYLAIRGTNFHVQTLLDWNKREKKLRAT